jgi:hypothetical protein
VVLHQGRVRAAAALQDVLDKTGCADVNAAFAALTAATERESSADAATR